MFTIRQFTGLIRELRFSHHCCWGFKSFGMWRFTHLEGLRCLHFWSQAVQESVLYLQGKGVQEDKDTTLLWNAKRCQPSDTASHPGRPASSAQSLWKTQSCYDIFNATSMPDVILNYKTSFRSVDYFYAVSLTCAEYYCHESLQQAHD